MSGFAADLPGIGAAATALRAAADSLSDVTPAPAGDVGPGRLGPAVAALLGAVEADLAAAVESVAELSETVTRVRDSYAELEGDAAGRFDQAPW
jgi:hypothetical protein